MTRLALVVLLLCSSAVFAADDCAERQAAGYRVLTMESGRKVAVWYPTAAREQPMSYSRSNGGFMGSVARDAPPAACPRVPLVLFSHGLGGCALQMLFFTEELARHGYIVAAPDHRDAVCAIGSDEHEVRQHAHRSVVPRAAALERSQRNRSAA